MFCVAARFAAAYKTCTRRASSYPQTELFECILLSVFRVSDTGARAKASLNKHLAYRILFLIWILSPRCAIFRL